MGPGIWLDFTVFLPNIFLMSESVLLFIYSFVTGQLRMGHSLPEIVALASIGVTHKIVFSTLNFLP